MVVIRARGLVRIRTLALLLVDCFLVLVFDIPSYLLTLEQI